MHHPLGRQDDIASLNQLRASRAVDLVFALPFQDSSGVLTSGMGVRADALPGLTVHATTAASSVACMAERIGSPSLGCKCSRT